LVSLSIISRITAWNFKIFGIQECLENYKAISASIEMVGGKNSTYIVRRFAFLFPFQRNVLNIYSIVSYFWALATLRRATINFVMFDYAPVRPHGATRLPLTDF
jgi:hypothetical protein